MLERLESPEQVLAFRAVGRIESADYHDVLEPAIDRMIADRDEVRLLYVLGDEFDEYSAGAGWEDAKLAFGHLTKWKRIAVVTNHDWVQHAVRMFGWMMPGDCKVFELDGQDDAMKWVTS